MNNAIARPNRLSAAELYRLKGDMAFTLDHDPRAAVQWYDRYVAEAPHLSSGLSNRGFYKTAMGRYSEALPDLEAAATGVLDLPDEDFLILQSGQRRSGGHMAMIAAGTGLGEAFMIWDGSRYQVVASEGGHVDFAPRDEIEIDLLRFLRAEFGHVSYERVLSGPGLHHIYGFLQSRAGHAAPDWLRHRLGSEDPSAVISEVALAGDDPVCVEALDRFVSVYGSEAGNLALKAVATGGVVVGGGIAPRIRARLADGRFVKAFLSKGRFEELLSTVPVKVALDPRAPLWGAARVAGELAGS